MEALTGCLLTFLLNSIWQIPLIAAVAALVCRLLRAGPARHRHAVCVAALLLSVLLPMASVYRRPAVPQPRPAAEGVPSAGRVSIFIPPPGPIAVLPTPARSVSYRKTTAGVVVSAYLLFVLFRLIRLAWLWLRTEQLRRTSEARSLPPLVEQVCKRCAEVLRAGPVGLLVSRRVSGPVTTGGGIILPASLLAEASSEVLTTAIGHEVAHVARRDFACNLLYELLAIPVAFHPAVWAICRGIKQTREMACDELVTRSLQEPRVYARSLLSIASTIAARPQPGWALGVFDGNILEERIRRLMENPVIDMKSARVLLVSGLSAMAVCALIALNLAFSARAAAVPSPAPPPSPVPRAAPLPPPLPPPQNAPVAAEAPAPRPSRSVPADDDMLLGAAAYNAGNFQGAVDHFAGAVQLDPANLKARLFLANSDLRVYFAGSKLPELLADAGRQYQDVLARDPKNLVAAEGMTIVALDAGQFPEARQWALRLVELNPKDTTPYFLTMLADFSIATTPVQQARNKAGIRPFWTAHGHQDPSRIQNIQLPDAETRKSLQDQLLPQIEEGLRMGQSALQLNAGCLEVLGYMTQLLSLKAAILDNPYEVVETARSAEEWAAKIDALPNPRFVPTTSLRRIYDPIDLNGPPPDPFLTVPMNSR